jgi:L-2-hydroxyglutarate oxidase
MGWRSTSRRNTSPRIGNQAGIGSADGVSMTESLTSSRYDVAVIGAGIIGLATADAIRRFRPELSIVVLEKEDAVAQHQTGRNSGVIHAGLYYAPGSLKAQMSVEGGRRLFEFCAEHEIPTTQTGEVVLAVDAGEIPALDELERRADANGVKAERIGPGGIRDREPNAAGIDGLWIPFTGSVDFALVARVFVDQLRSHGAELKMGFVVVNCAGLQVDRVARLLGFDPQLKILPFRGEYYGLSESASSLIQGHLYPVPDPDLPHLGVHFTRSVTGQVEVGPNAVWAWGREAYARISWSPSDALETLRYRGFWNLARRHWRTGAGEQWRSINKRAFVANARAMLPALETKHLVSWRSGIRAQAVTPDGSLIHDFVIREGPSVINVLNAPSPAATSCLTIGEYIAKRAVAQLS